MIAFVSFKSSSEAIPRRFKPLFSLGNIIDTDNKLIKTKTFGKNDDPCTFFTCVTVNNDPHVHEFKGYMDSDKIL